MTLKEPEFTLGVEEEYLLIDIETRDLISDPNPGFMEECAKRTDQHVSRELMRSQIEIGTGVCRNVAQAGEEVKAFRNTITEVGLEHGYAPLAVSTHPFAKWLSQKQTEAARYSDLTQEMQASARRLLICGMHCHVGIEDTELRIDLMNQMSYFLPHLLALSCSSPFWEGEDTGLSSYRLTVFDALPRTGLPSQFASFGEYQRHISILTQAGIIDEASKIWWDLRPSARFPTLETRVMDVCTNVKHALSLVALNVCLLRMLYRLRRDNQRWRLYSTMLISENRWRAMRYSCSEGMIDFAKGEIVPFDVLLEELMSMLQEDAEALDCVNELNGLRNIIKDGNSAAQQRKVFSETLENGGDKQKALFKTVDWLKVETVRHC
jgi:carboxylate-amine ligase